ncbi:MAG TPA: RDD family protein [Patescibacteria group bacterium]|jgi:uncharacterized RDD family membrane protein YckC|nr:RDD family protein [Patescibacteria group bacterium]
MAWYYAENGQQSGPVDDAQLEQLVGSGRIRSDTLVWREGMANWQPYAQVTGTAGSASEPPVMVAEGAPPGSGQVACAECGGVFNVEDTIAYGNARVCARCKPVFLQKLAEGAKLNTGDMVFAGFWTRFAAVMIDGVLLFFVNMATNAVAAVMFGTAARNQPAAVIVFQVILFFFNLAVNLGYETMMIGKYGATLGKMAMKVTVVTGDGEKLTYLRALGRYFAKLLSGFTLGIGYLMAAFDDEKRALHDRICNTRVIVKQ